MRTSTSTRYPFDKLGIDNAISLFKRSGFDCLDLSIDKFTDEIRRGDWKETASLCRSLAEKHGILDRIFFTGIDEEWAEIVKVQTPDTLCLTSKLVDLRSGYANWTLSRWHD